MKLKKLYAFAATVVMAFAAALFGAPNSYADDPLMKLETVDTYKCLLPYGASRNDGANIVQWDCGALHPAQYWRYSGGMLINQNSGRCMTPYGGSHAGGAYIVQWDCNTLSTLHKWDRLTTGNGKYYYRNVATGLYLRVWNDSVDNGTNVIQSTGGGTAFAR
ncbi:RICIN domain-containing protein [Streptomyces sp. NPDC089799]|uniref:RICIN domain-containing protein n=1 Tax=Streptomyces sp. NPDC089799 TaxID=3155066 RepID=UPI003420F97D